MNLVWQGRSNPLAWWWGFLTLVSGANIAAWFLLYREFQNSALGSASGSSDTQSMLVLCAAYVFGCAFRSVLPRADVQRICLFNTWLSSVMIGRTVATIAEVCFAAQWVIIMGQLGRMTGADTTVNAALMVLPLIVIAECFSWYAVLTRNFLLNAIENSLWAIAFFIIAIGLCRLLPEFNGPVRLALVVSIVGIAAYLAFLVAIDVPMYLNPVAVGPCRRQQAARRHRGSSRHQHPLGRDPRLRTLEGRDRLDVGSISAPRYGPAWRCAWSIRSTVTCRNTAPRRRA